MPDIKLLNITNSNNIKDVPKTKKLVIRINFNKNLENLHISNFLYC
jgi:hypothetical protein